ncbi:methyltransferase type 11 [Thozetella sp. PMI_491]|nr:methyltransferase type 11 [Thozetella sp. PMI_491]
MPDAENKTEQPASGGVPAPAQPMAEASALSESLAPAGNDGSVLGGPAALPVTIILPPEHWAQASPGDINSPARMEENPSSGISLSESIKTYRTIHGRTYHSEIGNSQYWGSNDDRQSDSLDILHHLFTLVLHGELFLAPIQEPKKVLDVGTGTGIWAIDFADQFPECEVIGTDISPIQPSLVPPNLQFEIEDCTREWTFEASSFDFVHIRYLVGSVPDWTELYKQAYDVLKPGGYLEDYEASPRVYSDDGTLPGESAMAQWGALFLGGGEKIGHNFDIVEQNIQNKAMKEAGFVDIQEKWIKIPAGAWPSDRRLKEIGFYASAAIESDIEGFILFVSTVQGWTREQIIVYAAVLRKELRSLKYHVWYWHKIVWGRKPE